MVFESSSYPFKYFRLIMGLFAGGVFFHTLARLVFFLWNHAQFKSFTGSEVLIAFLWGLRFDFSAMAAFLAPIFLLTWAVGPWLSARVFRVLAFLSFLFLVIPALALNFIDIEMINIVGRRFTFNTLFILKEAQGKGAGFVKDYGWIILSVLVLLALFIRWAWRWLFSNTEFEERRSGPRYKSLVSHYLMGFFLFACFVIAQRGGLQKKPLSFVQGQVFDSSWLNTLVMNSSFSIIKSAGLKSVERFQFFKNAEDLRPFLNGSLEGSSRLEGHRLSRPQNVVVIILESFALEYMGRVNGDQGYTPFLDSLAEKGLFFKNAVANGRRSIEGVPAVLAGVPTLMDEPFVTSEFSSNKVLKLPEKLKSKGYSTSFFHGGNNGTMYFDSFAQSVGYESYFGANEYPRPEDHDGLWGIYDEPFLQFFAEKLGSFKEPFFSTVFTLSSHQPYKVPETYKNQFPEGPLPVLRAVSYADYSLRKFFEKAEKESWYAHTLFVLVADHTQMSYRKDFQNDLSKYRVPIVFFHPQYQWPAIDTSQVVQQIDIPVSILDFLGLEKDVQTPLNQSVFVEGDKAAAVFLDGRYFLISKDYFLSWVAGREASLFSMADPFQDHPLAEPKDRKTQLENKLKAQLQFFSQGLLDNSLVF